MRWLKRYPPIISPIKDTNIIQKLNKQIIIPIWYKANSIALNKYACFLVVYFFKVKNPNPLKNISSKNDFSKKQIPKNETQKTPIKKIIPIKESTKKPVSENTLLSLCASAETTSTHPIAISIVNAAKEKGLTIKQPKFVEEIAGKGIKARLGKNDLLCGNRKLMEFFHIDLSAYENETHGTEVLVAFNGEYIGYIVIADTIKKNATLAISSIKKLGIKTAMLTGDTKENAEAIGTETGIEEIYAKLLPEDKLEHLKKIRDIHGAVMFVGDGINDAPVLAGADVGAAMGTGADAAIEAADVVFMTSSIEAIPEALAIARKATRISKQNVIFALAVKALVMVLGLLGIASMWLAVFADSGVAMLCVLNSIRILYEKK